MLKADYNSIIYDYLANESDINEIDQEYFPAMEADATSNGTPAPAPAPAAGTGNTANGAKAADINAAAAAKAAVKDAHDTPTDKTTNGTTAEEATKLQKAKEAVQAFLRKIGSIIDAVSRWIRNRIRTLIATDKGFSRKYQQQKNIVEPIPEVTVISYNYSNKVLEDTFRNIMIEVENCLKSLSNLNMQYTGRIGEILNAEQGAMLENLFKPHAQNAKTPIKTAPEFIQYIVGEYRGEKQERTYRASDLPEVEANALRTSELEARCSGYVNKSTQLYSNVKQIRSKMDTMNDKEEIAKAKENARKASILYNAYSSMIHMYFEIKLEQAMNYRIILKKFYNIM